MKDKTRKIALSALIAGAAGYVVGVLTAPKSGKETRKDIKNAASKAKSEAEKKLKEAYSQLTVLIDKGKKNASNLQSTAKGELANVLAKAQSAKERARHILSALHEEGADEADLKRVIADVNKSIDNLNKSIQKNAKKTKK